MSEKKLKHKYEKEKRWYIRLAGQREGSLYYKGPAFSLAYEPMMTENFVEAKHYHNEVDANFEAMQVANTLKVDVVIFSCFVEVNGFDTGTLVKYNIQIEREK